MVTLHHHTHILQTSPPDLQDCGIAEEHDATMSHCWSVALMPVNISLGLHGSVNMEAFDWLAIHHIIWFVTGCHFGASYHCFSLKMTAAVPHSRSVRGQSQCEVLVMALACIYKRLYSSYWPLLMCVFSMSSGFTSYWTCEVSLLG